MDSSLVLKGGTVFRPEAGSMEKLDVLIQGGRIGLLQKNLAVPAGVSVIDAEGMLVTPGLIDLHMHAFLHGHLLSVDVDELAPRSGTTTFVDGGSSGSLNFLAFREQVIKRMKNRILAFLNISAIGQGTDGVQGLHVYENDDDRLLHLGSAREVIEKNRDLIVGIKVRAYTGLKSLLAFRKARELADEMGLPIMVHTAPAPPEFRDLLPFLKEGDIVTHTYHGGRQTILDEAGRVREEVWEARRRGILFDVGLDRFHGDFKVIRAALEQGFTPHSISTDLAMPNLHHLTIDLPTTITKFTALGLPLEEALRGCTSRTAQKIGLGTELGSMEAGKVADIALFRLEEGDWGYEDYFGNSVRSARRLTPVMTLKAGEVLAPLQRKTESWDFVYQGTTRWHFD